MAGDNFLSNFSEVLRQQGEEREAQQQILIGNLERELVGHSQRLKIMYPTPLLEKLENAAVQRFGSDPRVSRLWDRIYGETYAEIYRRLLLLPD